MPQRCLKRMPDIFKSKNSQQKAIEKVWEVIQSGLHVRHTFMHVMHTLTPFTCPTIDHNS